MGDFGFCVCLLTKLPLQTTYPTNVMGEKANSGKNVVVSYQNCGAFLTEPEAWKIHKEESLHFFISYLDLLFLGIGD